MGNPINRAIEAEARFIEPLILNHDDPGELNRSRQGHAMLGDIGSIFCRVKLDIHNYR